VPATTVGTSKGWQYDVTTGGIYPNDPEYRALTNGRTSGEMFRIDLRFIVPTATLSMACGCSSR